MLPLMALGALFKFGSVFKLIIKYWQIIALVLLVLGAFLYVRSLNNEIDDLRENVVQLRLANSICESNKEALENAISVQNKEIEKWVKIGRKSKKDFDKLKERIEIQRKKSELKLQELLQEPKPQSCQGAIDYLVDGIEDLKWSDTELSQ